MLKNMTIVDLFESQVEKTPGAVAVCFEDHELTYSQLNRRANQLADFLQHGGVGKEVLVGLYLERSMEMVIAIIGILKAGGAYLPLDPELPAERVSFMLEDARVPIILSQSHLYSNLTQDMNREPNPSERKIVCLDTEWDEISQYNVENPDNRPEPEDLAYIIYTSGSTGQPKGVMIEHGSIYNRLVWMKDALELTDQDRFLQKSPYGFDASIWEIFWPLFSGARLVVARPGGHKDSDYLIDLIVDKKITAMHFVPSMLQVFLMNKRVERCRSLKRIFCGGEVLPYDLKERLYSLLDLQLYNQYGPTEVAIGVTCWPCDKQSDLQVVPIGKPLPNTQIHLLDSQLRPVPSGEPGEIHVGGVQVARGYLNRKELTAEKFIPDPFSNDSESRLYKTGDLARYLPDGTIHFLGRTDYQVKIRGNRVELGEIEATLTRHPSIREAVVIAHDFGPGDKRLAAYIVPIQDHTILINELRDFLAAKLPEYMVPASFTQLDSLPLNLNGKVDRQALPAPNRVRPNLKEEYVAPQSTIEKTLVSIWEQVIGLDGIGIHDNFLELGGDSILSIQVSSKANHAGLYLTPEQVFFHPTIAELADIVEVVPGSEAEQGLVTGSLPLTPIQHWFFEQNLPEPHHWNQAFLLEVHQKLDPILLEQAVKHLINHHDALRLRYKKDKSGWQQFMSPPIENVPFSQIELTTFDEKTQLGKIQSIAAELQSSLNLSDGPLIRVALFELNQKYHDYLLIIINHLVVDGVSWRILLEHLEVIYQQLSRMEPVELPPKTTSFKQWANRLTEYADSDRLQEELAYWLARNVHQSLELPQDFPDGTNNNTEASSDTVSLFLDVENTEKLLREVPKAYKTQINEVLLSALVQTFSQWTGSSKLLLDLEGHGREAIFDDVDLLRTVGWFTSIFPVLLSLEGETEIGEILKTIKEQLRQIPNRGIGYGILHYLSKETKQVIQMKALPQAELSFNYLGQFDQILSPSSPLKVTNDSIGPRHSLLGNRRHLLEIRGIIVDGRLQFDWIYSSNIHRRKTIEQLANLYLEALKTLIAHCQSPTAGRYTPSDFPEADLSQQELNDLLEEINEY
jgi:amino acid adenylation domain-containing protein/non-ribosomal peptide synthase protein (TIGR01720 family)